MAGSYGVRYCADLLWLIHQPAAKALAPAITHLISESAEEATAPQAANGALSLLYK